jgi:hypothetical protein
VVARQFGMLDGRPQSRATTAGAQFRDIHGPSAGEQLTAKKGPAATWAVGRNI